MKLTALLLTSVTLLAAQARNISGTWIAKMQGPMGEMEIVYRLKVDNGKVTGTQTLPFGDSPIVDGKITGDDVEMTVEMESFGNIQRRTVKAQIVGDELHVTPAMPGPPPGRRTGSSTPGAVGPGSPPPGGRGGMRMFPSGPIVARRGTPTPSYRAPSLDYKSLPKVELPQLKDLPPDGLAKTPPMGWNSWNKFRTAVDDKTIREIADAMVSRHARRRLCLREHRRRLAVEARRERRAIAQSQLSQHEGPRRICPLEGTQDRNLFISRSEDMWADSPVALDEFQEEYGRVQPVLMRLRRVLAANFLMRAISDSSCESGR